MIKIKKDKTRMILHLVLCAVVILTAISYFPVKKAVYADKNDERRYSKHGVLEWYDRESEHDRCIIEISDLVDRPELKESGLNYVGQFDVAEVPIYYETGTFEREGYVVQNRSPLVALNAGFDPSKVKNYFAIKFEWADWVDGEKGDGYYVVPIYILEWTPVYPIQRSGTLANLLLPKSYLTIWDFIGPKAVS